MGGAAGGLSSMWDAGNNRLRQFGLESFVVAGYRIDPLHIVAAVLGFILSGPMMLAVVIGALVISQSSGNSADRSQADARRTGEGYSQGSSHYARGDGPRQSKSKPAGPFSGTGQRLGS
ncbi:hypothetical protein Q1695_006505 [Nippostrongylus brasiliensis]|nr:hypothetical protein Q1695_006505 [Nippostrongylus brasiliensis]